MNPQVQGIDDLGGTYVFDLRVSNRNLAINRFFWSMIQLDYRERYKADPQGVMTAAGLTPDEQSMVLDQDWIGLVRHGVNFFVLEKFARVVKKTNLEVYALMRGESFEDFLKTRRVPEAR